MNNSKNIIIFLIGAGIGSAITYFYCKNQFGAQYEEYYDETDSEEIDTNNDKKHSETETLNKEYESHISLYSGEDENVYDDSTKITKAQTSPIVCTIDSMEFGYNPDYECVTYLLFEDDVLTDESGETVSDSDLVKSIGYTIDQIRKKYFYDTDIDSVYFLNKSSETYYEIIKENKFFLLNINTPSDSDNE